MKLPTIKIYHLRQNVFKNPQCEIDHPVQIDFNVHWVKAIVPSKASEAVRKVEIYLAEVLKQHGEEAEASARDYLCGSMKPIKLAHTEAMRRIKAAE